MHQSDVLIDVGAYIGCLSRITARSVGESGLVFAIEAHPKTYKILEENGGL